MQEDLITFETAKLARELGFKEPTFNGFYKNGDEIKEVEIEDYPYQPFNWNDNTPEDFARPTQSLLQKWLREIHNISIDLTNRHTKDNKYWVIIQFRMEKPLRFEGRGFENTLEVGLFEALNRYVKK